MEMESGKDETPQQRSRHHFVLVHGLFNSAWCWDGVAAALRSAGHRVTAPDLSARVGEARSFEEYSGRLLEAVAAAPPGEKVVLVGHSFGGHSLALAMEAHPEKVAVAVFVAAIMPVASLAQEQDLAFATIGRPSEMYLTAMTGESVLTEGRYGAVSRVFVVAEEDEVWPAADQRRLAASSGQRVEVRAIQGAGHMLMLFKPAELAALIMEVADNYAIKRWALITMGIGFCIYRARLLKNYGLKNKTTFDESKISHQEWTDFVLQANRPRRTHHGSG